MKGIKVNTDKKNDWSGSITIQQTEVSFISVWMDTWCAFSFLLRIRRICEHFSATIQQYIHKTTMNRMIKILMLNTWGLLYLDALQNFSHSITIPSIKQHSLCKQVDVLTCIIVGNLSLGVYFLFLHDYCSILVLSVIWLGRKNWNIFWWRTLLSSNILLLKKHS